MRFNLSSGPLQHLAGESLGRTIQTLGCMGFVEVGNSSSRRNPIQRYSVSMRATYQLRLLACLALFVGTSAVAQQAIVATQVPGQQTVELQEGTTVTLMNDQDGTWRIGDQVATNGYRHVEDGKEYLLEWTGAQWRLAKYTIRTIAGTVDVAEGVAATEARLFRPSSSAFDSSGNLYVSEEANHRVRKIDTAGVITTIAGTGEQGYAVTAGPLHRLSLTGQGESESIGSAKCSWPTGETT